MAVNFSLSLHQLIKIIRRPGFWFIAIVLALITIPHYAETLPYPAFLSQLIANIGLTRHAFERVLYLAPVVWAGFLFDGKGAFFTSLVALGCMLPRIFIFSDSLADSLFETGAVFIVGNVLAISFASLRREREYRRKLEAAQHELKVSEDSYRYLFENAHDAIWLHDLEGNFITINKATEKLTGYGTEELGRMNVKSFLSDESLELAHQIRKKLLNNEVVEQPYEQRIFRRDGSEAYIQLTTSLVFDKGRPVAFHHIARDITEQKRMNENLRFYFQQATKAQEEERKRISHELHDDTIQSLVVLSRQLDALATNDQGLSKETRARLEELWHRTDSILQGVRRLSQDLRPATLDRLGLLPAVELLASEVTSYSSVATKVNLLGKEHRLPEEVAIALFRITQEALRNVWRHSGATRAEITIDFNNGRTRITVSDNGKGFQVPEKMSDLAKQYKLGLAGMQERAQLVGGTLTVQSQPGKGTTVTVEAPG
jgi:PAS domain S-box-containing protein